MFVLSNFRDAHDKDLLERGTQMNIHFSTDEKEIIQNLSLPEGTRLLEQGKELLFSYEIQDGQFVMLKDFKEHDRKEFRKDEELPEITKEFLDEVPLGVIFDSLEGPHVI